VEIRTSSGALTPCNHPRMGGDGISHIDGRQRLQARSKSDRRTPALPAPLRAGYSTAVSRLECDAACAELSTAPWEQPTAFEEVIALVRVFRPSPWTHPDFGQLKARPATRRLARFAPAAQILGPSTESGVPEQVLKIARAGRLYARRRRPLRARWARRRLGTAAQRRHLQGRRGEERASRRPAGREIFELMEKFAGYGLFKKFARGGVCAPRLPESDVHDRRKIVRRSWRSDPVRR